MKPGLLAGFAGIASLCLATEAAIAQSYPEKPIRMITNGAPGGVTDTMAQVLTRNLGALLGVNLVVDNRPGAAGTIGNLAVVQAPKDGYTLLFSGVDGMGVVPSATPLPYDPVKDLIPVAQVTQVDIAVVAGKHLPVTTIQELVAYAKARPGKVTFAAGTGTMNHMAGELLKLRSGADFLQVPYKVGTVAITDLIGGRVDMMYTGVATSVGHAKNGNVRILAVAGPRRSSLMPDVPTMIESGYPDFIAGSWFGVFAPAGTRAEIINKLAAELEKVASSANFIAEVGKFGSEKNILLKEDFARNIAVWRELWNRVAREGKVRLSD